MFISVRQLHNKLGVDEKIARFFVDRKVPADNIFWKNKLLYVGRGNGYISIPVYYDLLFRLGISVELLLAEDHIRLMEGVMHYAISVEFRQISFEEQLAEIARLLSERIKDKTFYGELLSYLEQRPVLRPAGKLGLAVPALNRADVFLFILCDLPLSARQTADAVKYWYGLHSSYLLMDDMYDYKADKQDREENAIVELGDGETGFDRAFDILRGNIETLQPINPVLASYFAESLEELYDLNS